MELWEGEQSVKARKRTRRQWPVSDGWRSTNKQTTVEMGETDKVRKEKTKDKKGYSVALVRAAEWEARTLSPRAQHSKC